MRKLCALIHSQTTTRGACAPEAERCSTGSPAQLLAGPACTPRHPSPQLCGWVVGGGCWVALVNQLGRETFREGVTMTHKPTFLSSVFLNASMRSTGSASQTQSQSQPKENTTQPRKAFATLGKEL